MCDFEAQEDELLALSSIYTQDEFVRTQSVGEVRVAVDLPRDFTVTVKEGDELRQYGLSFLPPLILTFDLPVDYPSTSPPSFTLGSTWLSPAQLSAVCRNLDQLWQDADGSVVLFHWVQFLRDDLLDFLHIQAPLEIPAYSPAPPPSSDPGGPAAQAAPPPEPSQPALPSAQPADRDAPAPVPGQGGGPGAGAEAAGPGAPDPRAVSAWPPGADLVAGLLAHDEGQRRRAFEVQTFDCGVCFLGRPGSECVRFAGCGHVFCHPCMAEGFRLQIADGDVQRLVCPETECESTATPAQVKKLVGEELFLRYDRLLLQSTLDRMADVVYCPRRTCAQAVVLETDGTAALCPACRYAFCSLCRRGYHGNASCKGKGKGKVEAEESYASLPQAQVGMQSLWEDYDTGSHERKRFLEKRYGKHTLQSTLGDCLSDHWMDHNSKHCPRCSAKIEKAGGCNKMTCSTCGQYFCWTCLAPLSKTKPYAHFEDPNNSCYAL